MNNKIILQLLDILRGSPLGRAAQLEVALQALVWAELSRLQSIPLELRADADTPTKLVEAHHALARLGELGGLLGQAFSTNNLNNVDPSIFRHVLETAVRMSQAGLLEGIDASDVTTLVSGNEHGRWILPTEVADFLVKLAEIIPGESVYVPWDASGQLSVRAAKCSQNVYLENRANPAIPALVGLLSGVNFEVHVADPVLEPTAVMNGALIKFDAAISFPPFGQKYESEDILRDLFWRFPERTYSGTVLAVYQLLAQSQRRVVVAVQNSFLFSGGAEFFARQSLISMGRIEAVIAMPAGLLDSTNIPFSVLILSPAGRADKGIQFVNADDPLFCEFVSKARCRLKNIDQLVECITSSKDTKYSKRIPISQVLDNEAQLQVSRYILPDAAKRLKEILSKSEVIALGDVVETVRPMPISKNGIGIDVMEVGAADIPTLGYIQSTGRMLKISRAVADKNVSQFLRSMDVVLIIKGNVGKVGIVPADAPRPGSGAWVAGQSAIVLRAKPSRSFDPRVLVAQLRSPLGQEMLQGIVSGASIPLIQVRELLKMEVIVPSPDVVRNVERILEQEAAIQREIDQLREKQKALAVDMWSL